MQVLSRSGAAGLGTAVTLPCLLRPHRCASPDQGPVPPPRPRAVLSGGRLPGPGSANFPLGAGAHRPGRAIVVTLVGVHRQPDVLANGLADARQPVVVRLGVAADLPLDADTLVEVRPRFLDNL